MQEKSTISPFAAILAVVASFLLLIFLGSVILVLFGEGVSIVASELLVLIIPLCYMIYKRVKIRSYIGLDAKPLNILLGITFGVILLAFDFFVSIILTMILGPSQTVEEANTLLKDMSSSSGGLLLVIISLSLAGICEEFTFRGFLQTAVNSRYSFGVALLVSSLSFGFFHFDPQAFYTLSAFFMGLLLGYIYHRWHSYVIAAIAHATLNLITLTLLLLLVG
jgi:membrane protease YdiL (CAAX protease family)